MLVKNGVITQAQLDASIALQDRRRDKRLGELLVEQRRAHASSSCTTRSTCRSRKRCTSCSRGIRGRSTSRPTSFRTDADYVVSINPESLLLEGARRVDEWGLIEKKIPTFDIVFEVDHAQDGRRASSISPTSSARCSRSSTARRDVQAIVDASGLVEFEVGKALYGLFMAGFIHRIGKIDRRDAGAARGPRSRSIAISASRSTRPACSTRRCASSAACSSCAATIRWRASISVSCYARQRKWDDALAAFTEPRRRFPARRSPVFHNLAYVARAAAALRRRARRARRGGAPRRRNRPARADVARRRLSARRRSAGAPTRRSTAARPLFGDRPPTPAWYPLHRARRRAARRRARAASDPAAGGHRRAIRTSAVLLNNLAAVLERDRRLRRRARRRGARHSRGRRARAAAQESRRPALSRGALRRRARVVPARDEGRVPELGGDVYLKLGNIRLRRHERDEAVRCWERALELDPRQRDRSHQSRVAVRQVF